MDKYVLKLREFVVVVNTTGEWKVKPPILTVVLIPIDVYTEIRNGTRKYDGSIFYVDNGSFTAEKAREMLWQYDYRTFKDVKICPANSITYHIGKAIEDIETIKMNRLVAVGMKMSLLIMMTFGLIASVEKEWLFILFGISLSCMAWYILLALNCFEGDGK